MIGLQKATRLKVSQFPSEWTAFQGWVVQSNRFKQPVNSNLTTLTRRQGSVDKVAKPVESMNALKYFANPVRMPKRNAAE